MWHLRSLGKVIGALLLLCVPVLSLPCGPAGAEGGVPPGPQGTPLTKTPTIQLSVTVIDSAVKTIEIRGSGFTPGSVVTLGIPGLPTMLPEVKGLWFGVATVNESEAFTASIDLRDTLWNLVQEKVITEKELVGVYTVVAENKQGEIATAPLEIKKKE